MRTKKTHGTRIAPATNTDPNHPITMPFNCEHELILYRPKPIPKGQDQTLEKTEAKKSEIYCLCGRRLSSEWPNPRRYVEIGRPTAESSHKLNPPTKHDVSAKNGAVR